MSPSPILIRAVEEHRVTSSEDFVGPFVNVLKSCSHGTICHEWQREERTTVLSCEVFNTSFILGSELYDRISDLLYCHLTESSTFLNLLNRIIFVGHFSP